MTKAPKIYLKKSHNAYYANIPGRGKNGQAKPVRLGKTLEEATIALGDRLKAQAPAPVPTGLTLGGLIDLWLAHVEKTQSPATLRNYTRYASIWKSLHGSLLAASINPDHVSELLREKFSKTMKGLPFSDSVRWQVEKVTLGIFKWAVKRQHLATNPLLGYDRSTICGKRKSWISQEQYDKLIAACNDDNLRDLLETFWKSGARPFELFQVEARHYDAQGRRLILKRRDGDNVKAKKKEKDAVRVITLGSANEIVARLVAQHPTDKLFRNREGRPWNNGTAGRGLKRLVEVTGIKANGPIVPYTMRHSYATRMAKVVAIDELRKLMGHKDTRQLESLYDHSGDDADYMDGLARRAG